MLMRQVGVLASRPPIDDVEILGGWIVYDGIGVDGQCDAINQLVGIIV